MKRLLTFLKNLFHKPYMSIKVDKSNGFIEIDTERELTNEELEQIVKEYFNK